MMPPMPGGTAAPATNHARHGVTAAFMLASAVAVAGWGIGLLAVTGIATHAGGERGATYSAVYLSIVSATSAPTMPYGPLIAHRIGTRPPSPWPIYCR